jgi:murein L,D-transpeptidase YafK
MLILDSMNLREILLSVAIAMNIPGCPQYNEKLTPKTAQVEPINMYDENGFPNYYRDNPKPLEDILKGRKIQNPTLLINKTKYTLEFKDGNELITSYPCVFGNDPRKDKQKSGDHLTPLGNYNICYFNVKGGSKFHKFVGISYPNTEDAKKKK